MTKAEFVKAANAACKHGEQQRLAGFKSSGVVKNNWTRTQMAAFQQRLLNEVVVPSMEMEEKLLSAITPPAGEENQVSSILAAHEAMIRSLEKNPDAAAASQKFDSLAKKYGLSDCLL